MNASSWDGDELVLVLILGSSASEDFERCLGVGGVAVFPSDTVYGLACDPANRFAVDRLYRLKRAVPGQARGGHVLRRRAGGFGCSKSSGRRRAWRLLKLLPGALTLLLPNPAGRFPLACGEDLGTLGLRVPRVPLLSDVRWPLLQSSANLAGGTDPKLLDEVPEPIRRAADLVIDGGELPGTPSTVVDLRRYEAAAEWSVVRAGPVGEEELAAALG